MSQIERQVNALDLDGTLLPYGQVQLSTEIRSGLLALQTTQDGQAGNLILPNTTKGLVRLNDAMFGYYTNRAIVENGGAVYSPEGQLITSAQLDVDERRSVADTIVANSKDIRHAVFYPMEDPQHRAILFATTQEVAAQYQEQLGDLLAEVYTDPVVFVQRLIASQTCMVEVKPNAKDISHVDFFEKGINASTDGIFYVNHIGANKGEALRWVIAEMAINTTTVTTAGDSTTDQPAFDVEGVTSISVANPSLRADRYVGSPQELIAYLLNY